MGSSGHRANILNSSYRLLGVGAVQSSQGPFCTSRSGVTWAGADYAPKTCAAYLHVGGGEARLMQAGSTNGAHARDSAFLHGDSRRPAVYWRRGRTAAATTGSSGSATTAACAGTKPTDSTGRMTAPADPSIRDGSPEHHRRGHAQRTRAPALRSARRRVPAGCPSVESARPPTSGSVPRRFSGSPRRPGRRRSRSPWPGCSLSPQG